MSDTFRLQRFVEAQAPAFETACEELRRGQKSSHWMWFVFPQLKGLGTSPTAQLYAIASPEEAKAYQAHPILGPRLVLATGTAMSIEDRTIRDIFGAPDDLKFRSCMTLFEAVAQHRENIFAHALDKLCGGTRDERTLAMLTAA